MGGWRWSSSSRSAVAAMMGEERLTLMLVNLASIMERADEALLPGVYQEIGEALHVSPSGLGSLTLFRSIVQSSCYPLAVYMASRYNRTHVIAIGAFLWAAATFLVGLSSTFTQIALSRGLNGVGLALVTPAIQSLVADSTDDHNRGIAFGWLQLTGNLGSILGGVFSLFLATRSFMGIPGWRMAFHLVGIISVVVGILVRAFAVDPHYSEKNGTKTSEHVPKKSIRSEIIDLLKEAKAVMKVPSFQVIVAQGVTGSFPWSALSFAPLWLELIGFSHGTTAFLTGIFVIGGCLGALFGGSMGDFLAKRHPNSGRILLSQISSALAIPLGAVLLLVLPDDPSSGFTHGLVMLIMGFSISWNAPATNNPIFAEIVPEKSRTSIYALDRSFESVLSSFAPPVVGLLAEHIYGYKPVPRGSSAGEKVETDRENAASLAKALYTAIAIPMSLCCFIYSFLYCTYPRDKERARMNLLIESELQHIEMENRRLEGSYNDDFAQLELVGDRTVIEMVYSDEDNEINDSDENILLSQDANSSNWRK